jgi:PKD repeat protein
VRALVTALLAALCGASIGAAQRGLVTGVRASAATVNTGEKFTVTVSGRNPCGAANVDYGDGTAITYAITGLPSTHEHAYQKPGNYTIVARGEGNCDGDATTKIDVKGQPIPAPAPPQRPPQAPPAGPPHPQPQITAVNLAPTPAIAREPVAIGVDGTGSCTFSIDFGDGNAQTVEGNLPRRVTHTFGAPDKYTIVVRPEPPCAGKFTEQLEVVSRVRPAISDVIVEPSPANARQPVTITVQGTGTCTYTIDFGDGNVDTRSRQLPDRVQHVYTAADSYTLGVSGTGTCTGGARVIVFVQ